MGLPLVRSERFRLRAALVLAAGLHALVAALIHRPVVERARAPLPSEPTLVWIEESAVASQAETSSAEPSRLATPPEQARPGPVLRTPTLGSIGEGTLLEPQAAGEAFEESSNLPLGPRAERTEQLSLDDLGIGKNPFLSAAAREIKKAPPPERGIRRSLANAIAKSDQARGLGPEGPVLARLEQETRQSDAPGNSTALFRVTTDARGLVIGFELLEATSGAREFRALAARLLAGLRDVRLRVPRGVRGVTMVLRVVSHVELPSGHDPGMGVDILGIPLKKQGGEKSPRVSILRIDPKGYKVELPDGKTLTLPSIPLAGTLELAGDPADIGAKAQRMVRAHLEHISTETDSVSF